MEYKELANGVKIPVLGIGTWGFGGKHTADYSNDEESVTSIRAALDLGLTLIDTAEYYGAGHTEELVGKAIEPYERNSLFITSKVYRTHLRYEDVISSVKNSLKRLKTDYLDLCLIHWPNPAIPLGETVKAFEQCVDEGLARFIGVSNFSVEMFTKAQSLMKMYKLVANQVYYNLTRVGKTYFFGLSSRDVHSYCKEHDIMLIAWSPLEEGKLAKPGFQILDETAKKYRKTPAQVSLNWLISQEKIVAVPKASSINHLREFIGALGWKLNDEDSERLEKSFVDL